MAVLARGQRAIVEEVMDYRTYCCAIASLVQKPTAALVLNLEDKKECKTDMQNGPTENRTFIRPCVGNRTPFLIPK